MITSVNFELSRSLQEKGFKKRTEANWWILDKDHSENYNKRLPVDESKIFFTENSYELELKIQIDGESEHNVYHVCSAPTIAEVVMWLYEKYGIWISVDVDINGGFRHITRKYNNNDRVWETTNTISISEYYSSPTEAYENAIVYVLNNLI